MLKMTTLIVRHPNPDRSRSHVPVHHDQRQRPAGRCSSFLRRPGDLAADELRAAIE